MTAVAMTMRHVGRYRLPEPTRQADALASLGPCRAIWLQAQQAAEQRADGALLALYGDFPSVE